MTHPAQTADRIGKDCEAVLKDALLLMRSIHKWSVESGSQVLPGNTEGALACVIGDAIQALDRANRHRGNPRHITNCHPGGLGYSWD